MSDQDKEPCPCFYCQTEPIHGDCGLIINMNSLNISLSFPGENLRFDMEPGQAFALANGIAEALTDIEIAIAAEGGVN